MRHLIRLAITSAMLLASASIAIAQGPLRAAADAAKQELSARETELEAARTVVIQAFNELPASQAAMKEAEALLARWEQARQTGTMQQRLDASSAYNKVRMAVDADRQKALAADAKVQDATAAVAAARAVLSRAEEAISKAPAWRLKLGAPLAIRDWFERQPELKQVEADALRKLIDQAYATIERAERDTTPAPSLGGLGRSRSNRPAGNSNRGSPQQAAAAREQLPKLKEALKSIETDKRTLVVPSLQMKVDSYGRVEGYVEIFQVVGPGTLIVKIKGQDVWLTGVNARGARDDVGISLPGNVMLTGTKSYTTAIGGSRTILMGEICDHKGWLDETE